LWSETKSGKTYKATEEMADLMKKKWLELLQVYDPEKR
jgi:hypothetical protein